MVVTDPRGIEIRRRTIKFSSSGLEDFSTATEPDSITGSYQFSLYIVRDDNRKALLGTTSVRVEEFQPDRMSIKGDRPAPPSAGGIPPDALSATVKLRTLFGTAAAGRRIKGSFQLMPSGAAFSKYHDYLFFDPYNTNKSYNEELGDLTADADGGPKFDLKLERFDKALYQLLFVARGYAPEGRRSVATDT